MNNSYTPEQKERRERGLCIDCGKAVDVPKRHVRCQSCRALMAALRTSQTAAEVAAQPVTQPVNQPIPQPTADPISKPAPTQRKLTPYEISQRRAARERNQANRKRCETCDYITFAGANTWFCPLAVCLYEA